MTKVAIIGKFGTANGVSDGQAVKTNIVAKELEDYFGVETVSRINTYGWKKNPIKLFAKSVLAVFKSDNVIFMTDAGGIKIFPWLLVCANAFARRTLHYVVVGGWLIHFLPKHKCIMRFLKQLDGVFVETNVMKKSLQELGFENVHLFPNFKRLSPVSEEELIYSREPYHFCIFSRVMKEKGVDTAVDAVRNINDRFGRMVCVLDIFGEVDSDQIEWFNELTTSFPEGVKYCGVVPYDESVDVIKGYHALLFPTKFFTEGIPGTIIDAYAAGVPVVASEWESFADVVDSGKTGIGYPFDCPGQLEEIMVSLIEEPERVYAMKKYCVGKAKEYLPEATVHILLSKLT